MTHQHQFIESWTFLHWPFLTNNHTDIKKNSHINLKENIFKSIEHYKILFVECSCHYSNLVLLNVESWPTRNHCVSCFQNKWVVCFFREKNIYKIYWALKLYKYVFRHGCKAPNWLWYSLNPPPCWRCVYLSYHKCKPTRCEREILSSFRISVDSVKVGNFGKNILENWEINTPVQPSVTSGIF